MPKKQLSANPIRLVIAGIRDYRKSRNRQRGTLKRSFQRRYQFDWFHEYGTRACLIPAWFAQHADIRTYNMQRHVRFLNPSIRNQYVPSRGETALISAESRWKIQTTLLKRPVRFQRTTLQQRYDRAYAELESARQRTSGIPAWNLIPRENRTTKGSWGPTAS